MSHQQHSSKYIKNYSCIIMKRRKKVGERKFLPSTGVQAYNALPHIGIQDKINAQGLETSPASHTQRRQ